jgi:RND family efflux transporter MFP subunit
MKLTKKRTLLVAGAVLVAVSFAGVLARGRTSRPDPSSVRLPNAAVATARRAPVQSTLTLSGEFKPFQEVDLHAKVAGYIRNISVDVGDRVHTGQVLAVLEIPELVAQLQEADASRDRARSTYQAAHSAYLRLKQVSETRPGLIAAQELEDALARDKDAEAHVAQTEASHRQISALSDYSRITAPFSGVITKRYADTGALIQAGTSSNTQAMPLVRLAEFDRLRLVLPVPESAVPRIHVGTMVKVVVPALGRTFEGRVARLSDDLDRQTRTMETEIDVRNADDSLVAGMYAETVLELLRKDSALTVPVQAVARNGAVATVLVVGKDDRLEQRSVKIGLEGTRRLEILAGLENGERVVVGSRGELRVGEKVAPKAVEESRDSDGGL